MTMVECEHVKGFSSDEIKGLYWLNDVLKRIIDKGPSHRSYKRAAHAYNALVLLLDNINHLHASVCDLEDRIESFTQLTTVKKGEA